MAAFVWEQSLDVLDFGGRIEIKLRRKVHNPSVWCQEEELSSYFFCPGTNLVSARLKSGDDTFS